MKHKFTLQYMEQSIGEDVIPPEIVEEYKKTDDNPQFRLYCISQEGDCNGKIVGKGAVATRYARDIIMKLNETLKRGVKAFMGHGATNDTAGRQPVGEIVRSFVKEVNGKLTQFAAVYIHPQFRGQKLDVASLETDVECEYDGRGTYNVLDVAPITGLALGDGTKFKPGFKSATLRAQVQYFLDKTGENPMTLEELLEAIKSGGHKPSDLFTRKQLESDELVKTLQRNHSQKEYDHRVSVEEKLTEATNQVKDLTEKLEKATGTNTELLSKVGKIAVKDVYGQLIKDGGYPEQVVKYLDVQVEKFNLTEYKDDETLKKELGAFVTKSVDEFKSLAAIMGVKLPDDKPPLEGDDATSKPGDADYSKPENNDFIV